KHARPHHRRQSGGDHPCDGSQEKRTKNCGPAFRSCHDQLSVERIDDEKPSAPPRQRRCEQRSKSKPVGRYVENLRCTLGGTFERCSVSGWPGDETASSHFRHKQTSAAG